MAVAVFVIAQAAAGPKKESPSTKEDNQDSTSTSSTEKAMGGVVESEKNTPGGVTILSYHYISSYSGSDQVMKSLHTSVSAFDSQMKYLKDNGYRVLPLDQVYSNIKNNNQFSTASVALTFNDGYADFYKNAYPVLKKYGYDSAVFVITNRPGESGFLSWSQLKKLADAGVIIGSQGVTNTNLTKVAASRAKEEMRISKTDISGQLAIKVNYFAYPYGGDNNTMAGYLKDLGYLAGFSIDEKSANSSSNLYAIPRKNIDGGINLSQFGAILK